MCSMRLPLGDLVVVFLLSVLAAVSPRTATASKPFTTELMVQNQDVGEVRFSTDGRWIYLEQLLPYREKGYFDRERDWGRSLSVLSIVDVATGQTRKLSQSPQRSEERRVGKELVRTCRSWWEMRDIKNKIIS